MAEFLEKCSVCQALVDEEDLFCANCGTEAPHTAESEAAVSEFSHHNFTCQGCGASMSYDASAQTLRCPFCGSTRLEQDQDSKALAPRKVIPFQVNHEQAVQTMRQWLGQGFWRPGDLATAAMVTKISAVYVPYWVFQADTFTYWTADSSQTPVGARGDWYPLTGEHRGRYGGLLIGASGVLTPAETSSLCPFELAAAKPADEVNREDVIVEQFRVQRKYARPLARQGLENMERQACQKYVPGRCRNLKVNVRLERLSSEPVLLPVWVMAYNYKGRVFRFLVNGQTGRASGAAPRSAAKIALAIAIVVLLAILLFLGIAAFAAVSKAGERETNTGVACRVTTSEQRYGLSMAREPILAGEPEAQDEDRDLRPQRMSEMVGQREVYERLLIVVDAALKRGEALGHILFDGPPGLGKTTFAMCIPRELGVSVQLASGPSLKAPKDIVPYLTNAEERSVLFIDEIHRLPKAVEEYLYTAMEDFRIDLVLGEGVNARTHNLWLKPFTLIGATTRAGLLSAPLRDRFPVREHLGFYTVDELTEIIHRNSRKLTVHVDEPAAREIAERSRSTPRIANNQLRWVRDYADSRADGRITLEVARAALKMSGVDTLGLGKVDRDYLSTLIRVFGGGPAGLEAIAHTMNASPDTLEDEVEPFLLRSELVVRTPRGRIVTGKTYRHLNIEPGQTGMGDPQARLF